MKRNRYKELKKETPVIIDDLQELNERYIKSFIDLQTHYGVVDADFYIAAQKALAKQYQTELSLKGEQARAKTNEKFYLATGLAEELDTYTYRRRFREHKSPVKRILDERIWNEAQGYCAELSEGLDPVDVGTEFIKDIAEEFVSFYKRRYFIARCRYIAWEMTEKGATPEQIFDDVVYELTTKKKREIFIERKGKYLKSIIAEYLQEQPAAEEEAAESVAGCCDEPEEQSESEDELSALDEYQSGEAEYAKALKLAAETLIASAMLWIESVPAEAQKPDEAGEPDEPEQITLIELAGAEEDELAELEELQEIEEEE